MLAGRCAISRSWSCSPPPPVHRHGRVLVLDAGGMMVGYATSSPMNWWLIRRGIKDAM
jgi:hypothetical protein